MAITIHILLYVGLGIHVYDVNIKQYKRADSTHDRPGNMIIEFNTQEYKIKTLRKKRQLKNTNEYYDVYIYIYIGAVKSKSYIVVERNFSTMLKYIPGKHNHMMASNGKILGRTNGTRNDP